MLRLHIGSLLGSLPTCIGGVVELTGRGMVAEFERTDLFVVLTTAGAGVNNINLSVDANEDVGTVTVHRGL